MAPGEPAPASGKPEIVGIPLSSSTNCTSSIQTSYVPTVAGFGKPGSGKTPNSRASTFAGLNFGAWHLATPAVVGGGQAFDDPAAGTQREISVENGIVIVCQLVEIDGDVHGDT